MPAAPGTSCIAGADVKFRRGRADLYGTVLVERFPVAAGIVAGIAVALTGVFVLALPMYRSPIDRTMLGSRAPRYSVTFVRRTFADYGVRLRYTSRSQRGVTTLGVLPPPWLPTSLYVAVGRRGSEGEAAAGYDRRVGNVDVHYGGSNERVLARVRAAVAALQSG